MLVVKNLCKSYGNRLVVDHVSFSVGEGKIIGLLGKNGAGKTTSFRMTIGMIRADQGQVFFKGEEISSLPMYQRARKGMGYLAQEPSIFRRMTVEDNIMANLSSRVKEMVLDERDLAGALPMTEVLQMRGEVMKAVRGLMESGEFRPARAGEDLVT